jgi:hypothetical protein
LAPGDDALGTKAVRFVAHLLASSFLLIAAAPILIADEFRTSAISAVERRHHRQQRLSQSWRPR